MYYQVLHRGAIYRINYTGWKTNPRPIIFVLYSSPFKVHALSINSKEIGPSDAVLFSTFINKMKRVPNVEVWSGRILYRILKTYFPGIVRKSYRTYKSALITNISLVSSGILPQEIFTDYAETSYNSLLHRDANFNQIFKIISQRTQTSVSAPRIKKSAPLYTPAKNPLPTENTKEPIVTDNEDEESFVK